MTVLFETDPTVATVLRPAAGADTQLVDSITDLRRQLEVPGVHDLVVLGPGVDELTALEIAAAYRLSHPSLGVVLVRRRVDSAVLRDAMRAGVREVVKADDLAALGEACQRSRELSTAFTAGQADTDGPPVTVGQLVTVFAAKGGCGKTTMATNLAVALVGAGRRVCLVDLDLAFGDVAIALQLFPSRTIADAVGLTRLDETAVRSLVTPHGSGLDTIVAPIEPGRAESVSGPLVRDLLAVLKGMYDVVVVDSPPAFTDPVLAAFDLSEHFVLLATLDIPAVKNLKLTLETLELLSYPPERYHVALNRSDAKVGLSVADVEKTLRTAIAVQVPSSRAVPTCINRGVVIVLDQPGHPVSVAIRRFAETILLSTAAAATAAGQPPRRLGFRRARHEQASR